jgi:CheY-like chemotaxis protein
LLLMTNWSKVHPVNCFDTQSIGVENQPLRGYSFSHSSSIARFECREAANGLQALQLLHAGEKFDLVLTATMMPRFGQLRLVGAN